MSARLTGFGRRARLASETLFIQLANPVFHRQFPALGGAGIVFHHPSRRHAESLGHANVFHVQPADVFGLGPLRIVFRRLLRCHRHMIRSAAKRSTASYCRLFARCSHVVGQRPELMARLKLPSPINRTWERRHCRAPENGSCRRDAGPPRFMVQCAIPKSWELSMNLKTLALTLKGLRVSGSWSQWMRKKTERGLPMNRRVLPASCWRLCPTCSRFKVPMDGIKVVVAFH